MSEDRKTYFTYSTSHLWCLVISLSSLCNGWLRVWVSVVQHLILSLTAYSRLSRNRPIHCQMLSSQHIRCLPRFLTPSMRPTITLPSTLSCGCLITCPKYRSLRDLMWFSMHNVSYTSASVSSVVVALYKSYYYYYYYYYYLAARFPFRPSCKLALWSSTSLTVFSTTFSDALGSQKPGYIFLLASLVT